MSLKPYLSTCLFICILAGCSSLEESAGPATVASDPGASSAPAEVGEKTPAGTEAKDGVASPGSGGDSLALTWKPPEPKPDKDDWILLKSGEWLRGELESLRRDELEFDSKELDDLKLDWDDVIEVRTGRPCTVVFLDRTAVTGTLHIRDDIVLVQGETERRFPRDRIVSIVPGGQQEWNYWTGKLSLGFALRSGNTDQSELTTLAFLRRGGPHSRFDMQYNGTIGKLDGKENIHNHRLVGKWDIFLTRRFYITPVYIEYFRDRFQNIETRLTPGAGVGYVLFDTKDLDWEVEGGGAYQYTRFDSVEQGEDLEEHEGIARFGTNASYDITDDVELTINYTVTFGVPETEDAYHHLLVLLSVEIFNDLDLDLSFIWDRVETPRRDDDGNLPEHDDFRLAVGLGYEF